MPLCRDRGSRGPVLGRLAVCALAGSIAACGTSVPDAEPVAGPEPAAASSDAVARPESNDTSAPDDPDQREVPDRQDGPDERDESDEQDRRAARVEQMLSLMDDEELAGQLLVLTVHGGSADDVEDAYARANQQRYGRATPGAIVEQLQPGGIVFIGNPQGPGPGGSSTGNTSDSKRVPAFVAGLQASSGLPLLVAIDQEHGPVARLGPPYTRFPSAMGLGAVADPDVARRVAAAAAQELALSGINVNLAPVADVNTEPTNPVIGVRSFGQDPAAVSELVAAHVTGTQVDAGIAATAKHFPGHGATRVDSHVELPTVDGDLGPMLRPFEAAIAVGVDLVMPGHLLVPAIDPDRPATTSGPVIEGLLRTRLGFTGVVVTDSLEMGAVRGGDDVGVALDALRAGVDLLLMPLRPVATRDAIVAALADGTLERSRVKDAVRGVLRLKVDRGLFDGPVPELPGRHVLAEHHDLAVDVGARAATLLGARCPEPLAGQRVALTGDGAARLAAHLLAADVEVADTAGTQVAVWDGRDSPAADGADIVLLTGSPYAAGRLPRGTTVILSYGDEATTLEGVARALASGDFTGRTPVDLPAGGASRPAGSGLRCEGGGE